MISTIFSNSQNREFKLDLFTMKEDIDELIRKNLKRILETRGLQQNRLAESISVHPSVINDILGERKPMGKDIMTRICNALNIEPWEFYWTERTPIIKDEQEYRDLQQRREAERAGIADMVREAESSWISAAKKKGVLGGKGAQERLPRRGNKHR